MKTIIYGGQVHRSNDIVENGYIFIEDGVIRKIRSLDSLTTQDTKEMYNAIKESAEFTNANGMIVAPGSIDMHTHGFAGKEFMNISPIDLEHILETYPSYGVTGISPTLVTDTLENLKNTLKTIYQFYKEKKYRKYKGDEVKGANLFPCYLESRYFRPEKRGAHNLDELVYSAGEYKKSHSCNNSNLTGIIVNEIEEITREAPFIKIISIDPSIENSKEVIAILSDIYRIAAAHSNCTKVQAQEAIDNGAMILTHAGNCSSWEKDYQGSRITDDKDAKNLVRIFLDSQNTYIEIIGDFVHVRDNYVKLLIFDKGVEKVVLITDACAAAGSKQKECLLGGRNVFIEGNAAYYEDKTLCGSILTMDQAIRNARYLGFSLNDAFKMVSLNPAKLLGIDYKRGSIEEEKYADIVIYDTDIRVKKVFIEGKEIYNTSHQQSSPKIIEEDLR